MENKDIFELGEKKSLGNMNDGGQSSYEKRVYRSIEQENKVSQR